MKVLVLRFSSIGDIVLTSPVLRCVKQQVPGAEVHVATKSAFADLLRFNPHVDQVHELGDDLEGLIRQLKAERFDRVIDLHHNLRTARIKRALGVPARSFNKLNVEKWLLVNLRIDRLPRVHIVDRYLATAADLGVKNDGLGLELHIPTERRVALDILPAGHRHGYTALAIGAAHATKRLPPHKLVALAKAIEGPIVLIGSEGDSAVARAIGDAVGARVYDATGRFDLLGSASLIGSAHSVIAHDSGAMHIACAFAKVPAGSPVLGDLAGSGSTAGSPPSSGDPTEVQGDPAEVRAVVSIWGNTVPQFGMGPYIPQHPERAL
ncbi:MAG TPA: glycosyltransferase family 9 protein, partial [Flavobacteriales bacterium]|nr:glycosyltransferase family 9 protein [Flavobacteriales bacterium]